MAWAIRKLGGMYVHEMGTYKYGVKHYGIVHVSPISGEVIATVWQEDPSYRGGSHVLSTRTAVSIDAGKRFVESVLGPPQKMEKRLTSSSITGARSKKRR